MIQVVHALSKLMLVLRMKQLKVLVLPPEFREAYLTVGYHCYTVGWTVLP